MTRGNAASGAAWLAGVTLLALVSARPGASQPAPCSNPSAAIALRPCDLPRPVLARHTLKAPRSPRYFHEAPSTALPITGTPAEQLLRRMLNAEASLALIGTETTRFAGSNGDIVSQQKVWRDGTRGLRIEYSQPSTMVGEVMVDDGRLYWHYIPSSNTLQLGPTRIKHQRVGMREIVERLTRGELSVAIIGSDTVADHPCTVLKVLRTVGGHGGYRVFWVDPVNGAQLKNEAYAHDGRLWSTSYYSSVQYCESLPRNEFAPPRTPSTVRIVPINPPSHVSSLAEAERQAGFTALVPSYLPDGYRYESPGLFNYRGKKVISLTYRRGVDVLSINETPLDPGRPFAGGVRHPRQGIAIAAQSNLRLIAIGNLDNGEFDRLLGAMQPATGEPQR